MDVVLCDNKYIPTHSMDSHTMSAGWQNCHTKRFLGSKKNTIGHTTFAWGLTCWPELLYACYSFLYYNIMYL